MDATALTEQQLRDRLTQEVEALVAALRTGDAAAAIAPLARLTALGGPTMLDVVYAHIGAARLTALAQDTADGDPLTEQMLSTLQTVSGVSLTSPMALTVFQALINLARRASRGDQHAAANLRAAIEQLAVARRA